jgi:NADH-quinone oxidoreductase subunit E
VSPLELPGAGDPYDILDPWEVERIQELRGRYPEPRSAILPALWILQHREGILSAEGMREVARALELPAGHVEAVASFYAMFFFRPHGRYLIEMCTNMSCLVTGARGIMRRFEEQLGVPAGGTTADRTATLLEVECIGACGGAPACQVNHRFFENLSVEKVDQMVADIRAEKLELHPFPTGAEAAARETLVDLVNPGANRYSLPPTKAPPPTPEETS